MTNGPDRLAGTPGANRVARSDTSFAPWPVLAILAGLLTVALLVIGYQVLTIESRRREVNSVIRSIEQRRDLLQQAREFADKRDEAREQANVEEKKLERLHADHSALSSTVEAKRLDVERLDSEIKDRQAATAELEGKHSGLDRELTRLGTDRDKTTTDIAEMNARSDRLQAGIKTLEKTKTDLEGQTSDLIQRKAELEGLRKARADLEADLVALRQDHGALRTVSNELQTTARAAGESAKEMDAARSRLTEIAEQAKKQLDGAAAQITTSAQDLKSGVRDVQPTLESLAKHRDSIVVSSQQLERASTDLGATARGTAEKLETPIESLRKSTEAVAATTKALDSQTADLSARLAYSAAEADTLDRRLSEVKAVADKTETALRQLQAKQAELGAAQDRLVPPQPASIDRSDKPDASASTTPTVLPSRSPAAEPGTARATPEP